MDRQADATDGKSLDYWYAQAEGPQRGRWQSWEAVLIHREFIENILPRDIWWATIVLKSLPSDFDYHCRRTLKEAIEEAKQFLPGGAPPRQIYVLESCRKMWEAVAECRGFERGADGEARFRSIVTLAKEIKFGVRQPYRIILLDEITRTRNMDWAFQVPPPQDLFNRVFLRCQELGKEFKCPPKYEGAFSQSAFQARARLTAAGCTVEQL